MIKEIELEEYKRGSILLDKMKKNLKEYPELKEFDFIGNPNSWDICKYFQLTSGDSQKWIEKGKNRCIITSTKSGQPYHTYIIEYNESGKIEEFISYRDEEDGFNLTIHQRQTYGPTIRVYEKKGNSIVKTSYSPRSAYLKVPSIEIYENPNRSICYQFELPDYENPKNVSVSKFLSSMSYQKRVDGFFYLNPNKSSYSLYHIFSRNKGINLQQVYQRLHISSNYQYRSKFFEMFKQAIHNTTAIHIPTELQETLNALPTPLPMPHIPVKAYIKSQKDFNRNIEVEYTD